MFPKVRQLFRTTNGGTRELVQLHKQKELQKQKAIELFPFRVGGTGSPAAQIVALTSRIQQLQNHANMHKKDDSVKRGMKALCMFVGAKCRIIWRERILTRKLF